VLQGTINTLSTLVLRYLFSEVCGSERAYMGHLTLSGSMSVSYTLVKVYFWMTGGHSLSLSQLIVLEAIDFSV